MCTFMHVLLLMCDGPPTSLILCKSQVIGFGCLVLAHVLRCKRVGLVVCLCVSIQILLGFYPDTLESYVCVRVFRWFGWFGHGAQPMVLDIFSPWFVLRLAPIVFITWSVILVPEATGGPLDNAVHTFVEFMGCFWLQPLLGAQRVEQIEPMGTVFWFVVPNWASSCIYTSDSVHV